MGDDGSLSTVYSVQAIAISNLVSYVLGHSDLQTVLITAAIRIAQCMGLDRQAQSLPPADSELSGDDSAPWRARVENETVRRIWWQLIIQDYFEIAFANNYSMSDFLRGNSILPMVCLICCALYADSSSQSFVETDSTLRCPRIATTMICERERFRSLQSHPTVLSLQKVSALIISVTCHDAKGWSPSCVPNALTCR